MPVMMELRLGEQEGTAANAFENSTPSRARASTFGVEIPGVPEGGEVGPLVVCQDKDHVERFLRAKRKRREE